MSASAKVASTNCSFQLFAMIECTSRRLVVYCGHKPSFPLGLVWLHRAQTGSVYSYARTTTESHVSMCLFCGVENADSKIWAVASLLDLLNIGRMQKLYAEAARYWWRMARTGTQPVVQSIAAKEEDGARARGRSLTTRKHSAPPYNHHNLGCCQFSQLD